MGYYGKRDFLVERKSWLKVIKVKRRGGGYDIAVVIDGTYTGKGLTDDMAEYWEDVIKKEIHHGMAQGSST